MLRGIEIYKDKPILYSLGDFIFENETLLRYPSENYEPLHLGSEAQPADFNDARSAGGTRSFPADREIWESVVALATWRDGRITGLELHPITLGFGEPPAERGRPRLAPPDLAKHILDNLVARSEPFGTTIRWRTGSAACRCRSEGEAGTGAPRDSEGLKRNGDGSPVATSGAPVPIIHLRASRISFTSRPNSALLTDRP